MPAPRPRTAGAAAALAALAAAAEGSGSGAAAPRAQWAPPPRPRPQPPPLPSQRQPRPAGDGTRRKAAGVLRFDSKSAAEARRRAPAQQQEARVYQQKLRARSGVPAAPGYPEGGKVPPGPPAGEAASVRLQQLLREMGDTMRARADSQGRVMASAVESQFAQTPVFANWWCSLRKVGAAGHAAVGAVDEAAVPILSSMGVHPVPMAAAIAEWTRSAREKAGAAGWDFWSYLQKVKPLLTLAGLLSGLSVLMLDTDIALFRSPFPYLAERIAAAAMPLVACQNDGWSTARTTSTSSAISPSRLSGTDTPRRGGLSAAPSARGRPLYLRSGTGCPRCPRVAPGPSAPCCSPSLTSASHPPRWWRSRPPPSRPAALRTRCPSREWRCTPPAAQAPSAAAVRARRGPSAPTAPGSPSAATAATTSGGTARRRPGGRRRRIWCGTHGAAVCPAAAAAAGAPRRCRSARRGPTTPPSTTPRSARPPSCRRPAAGPTSAPCPRCPQAGRRSCTPGG
eukprot:TRINITY_DN4942_c1_g3_i1.p1 TRINITY_DN4942_c1_g3~~TRINITY_DN4942_c1_g3_i1.p1  ORF type:complete len:532 (+),score=60.23 TRINITY_DN4942_c1_g3_i1:68-1597(+)